MGGTRAGRPLQVDDQPREDSRGATGEDGSELVVSGLHMPIRPRPAWPPASLSERVPGEEVRGSPSREAARVAGRQPRDARSDSCRPRESVVARLATLLLVWLPEDGVPRCQSLRGCRADPSSATSESTSLPASGWNVVLRAVATPRPATALTTMSSPCAYLSRKLSGKPDAGNPPVRFDEGRGDRLSCPSPTLLKRIL